MKKLISILLLMTFLLSSIPFAVGAEDTDGVVSSHGKLPFEDIDETSWYIPGLIYCYSNEIISGAGNTYTFNPKGELTRATFAVMLARAIKADTSVAGWDSFDDCDNSETCWYIDAVEWAYYNEYMNGTGDRRFSPNMTMTREQLATVFMRFMEKENYSVTVDYSILDDYTDADKISDWAVEGVKYAICAGLISSTATSHKAVSPQMPVTREQAVKLFMSFLTLYFYGDCEHEFSDATCTTSSVCSKCGMVNGLPTGHLCDTLSCKVGGTCKTCGETVEADEGLHVYPSKATCIADESCSVCRKIRTLAFGHNYTTPTCQTPAVCKRCGKSNEKLAEHSINNGKCSFCKMSAFDIVFDYLSTKDPDHHYMDHVSQNNIMRAGIGYGEDGKSLALIGINTYLNSDYYDIVMLIITRDSTNIFFVYELFKGEESRFVGNGEFYAEYFRKNELIYFTEYETSDIDHDTALSNAREMSYNIVSMCNRILQDNKLGVTLKDLGFVQYD